MNKLNPDKVLAAIEYIDTWLEHNFNNSRLPALQVAIQHEDKVVYSKPFGYANIMKKEKLTTKHAFRIASHSKTYTATAIMQLNEHGKIDLDDKVSDYVKWFKSTKDERVAEVTIRQLLNHTAGLIRDGEDADYWNVLRDFPDETELKEYISTSKLIYDSDDKFKYSNYGMGYLGCLIEAVSGTTYNAYVTKNIIKKLGLESTGSDLEANSVKYLATGYGLQIFNRERRALKHIDTKALAAATGFYATAEDVCKYFSAHFFGNTILLKDSSKRTMQHGYWKSEGNAESYGYGMVNYNKKYWKLVGHGGGFPGFITNTKFDAKKQLVVAVFINSSDGYAKLINDRIIDIIDTFQQDTDHIKPKVKNIKKFTGRFYSKWGALDIVQVGTKLLSIAPAQWSAFEHCEELEVVNENTLKVTSASGYSSPGELVHYTFDQNGGVKTIRYTGSTLTNWEKAIKVRWF